MSVILIMLGLVFGTYTYDPMLFDSGPYVVNSQKSEYATLGECRIDTHGTGDICVGDNPSVAYVMDKSVARKYSGELNYVQCDYWAGCYIQE